MKIQDQAKRLELQKVLQPFLNLYEDERTKRAYRYAIRKKYYDGEVKLTVAKGHEQMSTELCSAIADKMGAYLGVNTPTLNFTPIDISNLADADGAQIAEKIVDDVLDKCDFPEVFLDTSKSGAWSGDGFVGRDTDKQGHPRYYAIERPQNVTIGWKTDDYKQIDWWSYTYGITKEAAKMAFGEEFTAMYTDYQMDLLASAKLDPYGTKKKAYDAPAINMVKIVDFHCFVNINEEIKEGDNIVIINNIPMFLNKGKAKGFYHYIANKVPNEPTGASDFENAAGMVTMLDKKLSEEADSVSQGVYHKYVTNDRNAAQLGEKLKPNSTQVIKLVDENSKLDVLNLNSNSYNSEPLIKNIINVIRTNSFLQELGQDQVSPNISGRALAMIFQGVIQKVSEKRIRWTKILKAMANEILNMEAEINKDLKEIFFDEDGNLKFKVDIVWPDVLESDKQTKVVTVQSLRQGVTPLVSDYTARQMAGIPDPIQEDRRVQEEMEMKMNLQQQLQGTAMQPSTPEGPILSESQNQPGEGVPSGPGMAGSAQATVSPQGAANMSNQQQGA